MSKSPLDIYLNGSAAFSMLNGVGPAMTRKEVLAQDRKLHGAYDPVRLAKVFSIQRRRQSTDTQKETHQLDSSGGKTHLWKRLETRDDIDGDVPVSSADSLTPSLPEVPSASGSASSPFSNTDGGHDTINRDFTTITKNQSPASFTGSSLMSNETANTSSLQSNSSSAAAATVPQTLTTSPGTSPRYSLAGILTGTFLGVAFIIGVALLTWKCKGKFRFGNAKRRARSTSQKLGSLEEARRGSAQPPSPKFHSRPFQRQSSHDQPIWEEHEGHIPKRHSCYVPYEEEHRAPATSERKSAEQALDSMLNLYRPHDSYLAHARTSVLDMSLGTARTSPRNEPRKRAVPSACSRWSEIPTKQQLDGLALICESPRHGDIQRHLSRRYDMFATRPMTSPGRIPDNKSSDSNACSQTSSAKKLLASPDSLRKHASLLSPSKSLGRRSEFRGLEISKQGSSLLIRDRSYSSSLRRPLSSASASLASVLGMRSKLSEEDSELGHGCPSGDLRNVICVDTTDLIACEGKESSNHATARLPASFPVSHYHMPSSFARRVARKYPSLPELHALDEGSVDVDMNGSDLGESKQYAQDLALHRSHLGSCFSGNSTADSKLTAASDVPSPCASFTFEIKEIKKNAVGSNVLPEDLPRNVSLDLLPKGQTDTIAGTRREDGAPHGPSRLRHCVSLHRNATLTHIDSSSRYLPKMPAQAPEGNHMATGGADNFVQHMDWDLRSCTSSESHS